MLSEWCVQEKGKQNRPAVWLQIPRRILLLLIAFGVTLLLLRGARDVIKLPPGSHEIDWAISRMTQQPVSKVIGKFTENTLILLGGALAVMVIVAAIQVSIAQLVHMLESRSGALGSALKGIGRLVVFAWSAAPVICLGTILLLFAIRTQTLPIGGMYNIAGEKKLADLLRHMLLPLVTLTALASMLTAQSLARALTLLPTHKVRWLILLGMFRGLGVLLGQTGGLVSASILVEIIFSWPGLGRAAQNAISAFDWPVLFGILGVYAAIILVGRLLSELFFWLERLLFEQLSIGQEKPVGWPRTARVIWVVVALLFLLLPCVLGVAGALIGKEKAVEIDIESSMSEPSAEHLLGTDRLGRDLLARVLYGGFVSLGTSALVAVSVTLMAGVWGSLVGYLRSLRTWWSESLADLLLLPADVWLMMPILLGAALLTLLWTSDRESVWGLTVIVCVIGVLPRAARAGAVLWMSRARWQSVWISIAAGLGALWLGSLFAALSLLAGLDFMGLGVRPPLPSLGGLLQEMLLTLFMGDLGLAIPAVVLGVCAIALYIAADALIGFFNSKEVMAKFNG